MKKLIMFVILSLLIYQSIFSKGLYVDITGVSNTVLTKGSNQAVLIQYDLNTNAFIEFKIYNANKQLVFSKSVGRKDQGEHRLRWEGKKADGKYMPSGFYSIQINVNNDSKEVLDSDEVMVEIRDIQLKTQSKDIPPAVYALDSYAFEKVFKFDYDGYFRGATQIEDGDEPWSRGELYFHGLGSYGENISYDIQLFPSATSGDQFDYSDIFNASTITFRGELGKVDVGYRNYIEGYYDPMNLFSYSQLGTECLSFQYSLNRVKNLEIRMGYYHLYDLPKSLLDFRAEYRVFNGFYLGFLMMRDFRTENRNRIISFDSRMEFDQMLADSKGKKYLSFLDPLITFVQPTSIHLQYASNSNKLTKAMEDQDTDTDTKSYRMDLYHRFDYLPISYGRLKFRYSYEKIGRDFVAEFADLANDTDSKGHEFLLDYYKGLNLLGIKSFRLNTEYGTYSNNEEEEVTLFDYTGPPKLRENFKFRQLVSFNFNNGISFLGQFEDLQDKEIAPPPGSKSEVISNFVQANYATLRKGFRVSLRYSQNRNYPSDFQFASTRLYINMEKFKMFRPYLIFDRKENIYNFESTTDGTSTDSTLNEDLLMSDVKASQVFSGFRFSIFQKFQTQVHVQAGYSFYDDDSEENDPWIYYVKFQQRIAQKFNFLVSYGSLYGTLQREQFYLELKYIF